MIAAYIDILRPSNVGLFFMAIMLGAVMIDGLNALAIPGVWIAALSGTLIGGAANVINDVMDVEIDRINKPKRPLVSGVITEDQAKRYWAILNIAAVALAFALSLEAFLMAVAAVPLMYAYSVYFKRMVFIGNLVVCLVISGGFVFGALAVGNLSGVWFPVIFSFLFNMGREILKDLEDTKGDQAVGAETLAIRLGTTGTLRVVTLMFSVLILVSLVPYVMGIYGKWYLFSVMILCNSIVLFVIIRAWQVQTKENFYKLNTILKVAMLTGIISIAVGRI
ncbi:MAG: UbiA family prenyltransferase [Chlorobiales bacterium]|nr:UbiA family prenyltransferase [Chlorobiales bacterium]